jgi:uncharacterized protein (DUF1501 family)
LAPAETITHGRQFESVAGNLPATAASPLGVAKTEPWDAADYKALVCVFMFGGNDSSNMVMPSTNYAQYLAGRPLACGINIPNVGSPQTGVG